MTLRDQSAIAADRLVETPVVLSQVERLVKAARSYKGVSRIDFQLPDVIDGGEPILNFPGRMWDAERQGYSFEKIGRRNRCGVWRLLSESDVESDSGPAPTPAASDEPPARLPAVALSAVPDPDGQDALFDLEPRKRSHYDPSAA